MKRREFIILTSVGATGATVLSACGHPENKLIPALIPDNEYVPGLDYWKASACAMCRAGCGIVVRTREHKANKIEGNPAHPVNRGALCARGQAGLQALYNPDRIKGPMKRAGERGSGQFEAISWDEAIKILADKLREMKPRPGYASGSFITNDAKDVTAYVAARFMEAYGSAAILLSPFFSEGIDDAGNEDSHEVFDIANATYLLSFGARFLETWHSPVMYSLAYGEFRSPRGKARGKFVHVEPRMSLTAANADEWLPAQVGAEGLLALALAQVIAREGLGKASLSPDFVKALEEFAPEKTAEAIDIPAEKLIRIAREFANAERPLAISAASIGYSGKAHSSSSVRLLNALADNFDKKGGALRPRRSDAARGPLEKLRPQKGFLSIGMSQYWGQLNAFEVSNFLLVHQVNPLHITPAMREKLNAIPFIASFSSFLDETTEMADLILPDHSTLEGWNINSSYPTSGAMVVTLTQPVVKPEFDTRQTADVLLALSRELGGEMAAALPFASAEEIVKQAASDLSKSRGSINAEKPEDFWEAFQERGVWIAEADNTPQTAIEPAPENPLSIKALTSIGDIKAQPPDDKHSLTLMVYEHSALGDGAFANLPGLQELPDPMTSVIWGSWVEINPKTAASLGIADGDLIAVSTPHGLARAPAVIYPAIRPDVIAMPFGQGHTAYGRYAKDRGASAASLLPPAHIGGQAEISVRAQISKVAGEASLIRFGTDLLEKIENDRSR